MIIRDSNERYNLGVVREVLKLSVCQRALSQCQLFMILLFLILVFCTSDWKVQSLFIEWPKNVFLSAVLLLVIILLACSDSFRESIKTETNSTRPDLTLSSWLNFKTERRRWKQFRVFRLVSYAEVHGEKDVAGCRSSSRLSNQVIFHYNFFSFIFFGSSSSWVFIKIISFGRLCVGVLFFHHFSLPILFYLLKIPILCWLLAVFNVWNKTFSISTLNSLMDWKERVGFNEFTCLRTYLVHVHITYY